MSQDAIPQEVPPLAPLVVTPRPRIGIALSGGSAYGLAHLGVFKWMEQNRIPVDYVSGTSMGSLVGGFYSTGLSVTEIEGMMSRLHFDELFRSTTPHNLRTFRRKEDLRRFQNSIEFGGGFTSATGLESIHPVGVLLSRVAFPYPDEGTFDELPIPFRCVAVDLDAARPVVFDRGSLALAMRASMSIPIIFTAVESQGRSYVDGSLFDQVPTDTLIPGPSHPADWQPNVLITVRMEQFVKKTGAPRGVPRPKNLLDVVGRIASAITADNTRRSIDAVNSVPGLAHVPIIADVTDLSGEEFGLWKDFEKRGYGAAEAHRAELLKYQLSPEDWAAYLAAKNARRKRTVVPKSVRIAEQDVTHPLSDQVVALLYDRLKKYAGKTFTTGYATSEVKVEDGATFRKGKDEKLDDNSANLEKDLNELTGYGLFESISYDQLTVDGQPTLVIRAKEKRYGPPYLLAGARLDSSDIANVQAQVLLRANFLERNSRAGDTRADVVLGAQRIFALEKYEPTNRHGIFFLPSASIARERRDLTGGPRPLAQYTVDNNVVGFDTGLAINNSNQFRIGYRLGTRDYNVQAIAPGAEARNEPGLIGGGKRGTVRGTVAQYAFDGQDDPIVPLHGNYTLLRGVNYDASPLTGGYGQVSLYSNQAVSVSPLDSLYATLEVGKQFRGTAPAVEQFRLGGTFRLSSVSDNELRGESLRFYSVGYLRRLTQRYVLVGGALYGGIFYENGLVSTPGQVSDARYDYNFILIAPTHLGPISGGVSIGNQAARRLYLRLGHSF